MRSKSLDQYPALQKTFSSYKNFSTVVDAIEQHFGSLFDLALLNELALKGEDALTNHGYYQLFRRCVLRIEDRPFTVNEVVTHLSDLLNNDDYVQKLLSTCLMLVDKEDLPPKGKQLGYPERLVAGVAEPVESLSFIDMLRFVKIFDEDKSYARYKPKVFNLKNLSARSPEELAKVFGFGHSLLINLSTSGEPKWAAIHITNAGEIKVYCEAILLEIEKKQIERLVKNAGLWSNDRPVTYEGQTADLGASSGYLAVHWIVANSLKDKTEWADKFLPRLKTAGNFWSMRSVFLDAMSHFCNKINDKVANSVYSLDKLFSLDNMSVCCGHNLVAAAEDKDLLSVNRKIGLGIFLSQYGSYPTNENQLLKAGWLEINNNREEINLTIPGEEKLWEYIFRDATEVYSDAVKLFLSIFNDPASRCRQFTLASTPPVNFNLPNSAENYVLEEMNYNPFMQGFKVMPAKCDFRLTKVPPHNDPDTFNQKEHSAATYVLVEPVNPDGEYELYYIDYRESDQCFRCKKVNVSENRNFSEIKDLLGENSIGSLSEEQLNAIQQVAYGHRHISKNPCFAQLETAFQPVLARNQWLAFNHYQPPLMGDHWHAAAVAWLRYLYQHPRVDLSSEQENHAEFKQAIEKMGPNALLKLLTYLSEHRSEVKTLLGETKPGFYFEVDDKDYYQALINHLKTDSPYFPFSRISIRYIPEFEDELVNLLQLLNQLPHFRQIQMINAPEDAEGAKNFLTRLSQEAFQHKWTATIDIKGLSDRWECERLNNVILGNSREKFGNEFSQMMQKIEQEDTVAIAFEQKPKISAPKSSIDLSKFELDFSQDQGPWPLSFGGGKNNQIGTRRQIERQHQRQIQRQLQHAQTHHPRQAVNLPEKALRGGLVNHKNVNEWLKPYYQKLQKEFAYLPDNFDLKQFFADIISANPDVKAPHVIYYMTEDAAEYLLRKYLTTKPKRAKWSPSGRLAFGLNTHLSDLPKGLFTQRTKDDDLVLCYDPGVDKGQDPTPLTLDLDFSPPVAVVAWQGDFTQLNSARYYSAVPEASAVLNLNSEDLSYMAAFIALQPKRDDAQELQQFIKQNPQLKERFEKITENWPMFRQTYHYAGLDAALNILNEKIPIMTPEKALRLIVSDQAFAEKLEKLQLDDDELLALGQAYYRSGESGLIRLVDEFTKIAQIFPEQFVQFKRAFLKPCEDMSVFCTPSVIEAFREMRRDLVLDKNPNVALIWWHLSQLHADAVGFEQPEKLWQGFQYFVAELLKEGVEFNHLEAFQQLKPSNMLVWMDRVLACIRQIPRVDDKQSLLDQINHYDLNWGDLPYALQEGIKRFDRKLQLSNFQYGDPTYAPNLENIFNWPEGEDFSLRIRRLLATQSGLSNENYATLCDRFIKLSHISPQETKSALICLLLIEHSDNQADVLAALDRLIEQRPDVLNKVAAYVQQSIYQEHHAKPAISLSAVVGCIEKNIEGVDWFLANTTTLEMLTILHQRNATPNEISQLATALSNIEKNRVYPEDLLHIIYRLSAMFGAPADVKRSDRFVQEISKMRPAARQEFESILLQLQMIDWQATEILGSIRKSFWMILNGKMSHTNREDIEGRDLNGMIRDLVHFIEYLTRGGVVFKQTIRGNICGLKTEDKAGLNLSFFVDHEKRLWEFLERHIAIPKGKTAAESLNPLLTILKQMQVKRGDVNEIEYLLLVFKELFSKSPQISNYWHVDYFCALLKMLEPVASDAAYPIGFLKTVLSYGVSAAKPMEELPEVFPNDLSVMIQTILKNPAFTRGQQQQLATLALREFTESKSFRFTPAVADRLEKTSRSLRSKVLQQLLKGETLSTTVTTWANCLKLLDLDPANETLVAAHWPKTFGYWLKAMTGNEAEQKLFEQVMSLPSEREVKLDILHILAFSTLHPGLKSPEAHQDELSRKAPELVASLLQLSPKARAQLAAYYPTQPAPTAENLLHILKIAKTSDIRFALDEYEKCPHPDLRADYARLAVTRRGDFERLIREMQIKEVGVPARGLNETEEKTLRVRFELLQQFESGKTLQLAGIGEISIANITRKQRLEALNNLSNKASLTEEEKTFRLAIYFDVLGQVSKKYPTLVQQLSLLAADILPASNKKVTILGTGEGKGHFNALRALHYLNQGVRVHIHTAKRSLAKRDHKEYRALFNYLEITSGYLTPDANADLLSCQVIYVTTSDLSLFLNALSYAGNRIKIDPEKWVALFDEIDFIRFDEGLNTAYNFSVPDEKTSAQMSWFYRVLNTYCEKNLKKLTEQQGVYSEDIKELMYALVVAAGENTSKQSYLLDFVEEPRKLVRWIQASSQAVARLNVDQDFYLLSKEKTKAGEEKEPDPMRRIVPATSDNQSADGSTFVGGVQPLLAEHLNTKARDKDDPQNVYVARLSHVLSSQVADSCIPRWYEVWEGSTASLSDQQAKILGASVVYMPTNQPCLREWKEIEFFEDEIAYQNRLADLSQHYSSNQQSILIACENDISVKKLHDQLNKTDKDKFAYASQLLCFTNDSEESSKRVLARKKTLENPKAGEKKQGVVLLASGLGRGDNVNVRAVLIPDLPKDHNALVQTGGRAARPGTDDGGMGAVHQVYRWSDVKNAYETATGEELKQSFSELTQKQKTDIFYTMLASREKNNFLSSRAVRGYQAAKAEYSDWGLSILSSLPAESHEKELFEAYWASALEQINDEWLTISSVTRKTDGTHKTDDEKIADIVSEINKSAVLLLKKCAEMLEKKGVKPAAFTCSKVELPVDFETIAVGPTNTSVKDKHVDEIFQNMVLTYVKEADRGNAIQLMHQACQYQSVGESMLIKWLEQWERLARGKTIDETSTFLLAMLRVIVDCKDAGSVAIFAKLFDKTLAWWNKNDRKYQKTLLDLWNQLGNYNRAINLIQQFEIGEPGKLGFTWLSSCTKLSEEEFEKYQDFIAQVLAYLKTLPIKKPDKIQLFNKIITTIEHHDNAAYAFSLSHISIVLNSFVLQSKATKLSVVLDPKLLLLVSAYQKAKLTEDDLKQLSQVIMDFLAATGWTASEIDACYKTIIYLLQRNEQPLILINNLLLFQQQCCDNFTNTINYFDFFAKNYKVLLEFFVGDKLLNDKFVALFKFVEAHQNTIYGEVLSTIADLYYNVDLERAAALAQICLTCIARTSNMSVLDSLIRFDEKKLSNDQLVVINEICKSFDSQHLPMLLTHFGNLNASCSEQAIVSYSEKLRVFYQMSQSLQAKESLLTQSNFGRLDLMRANYFLDLAIRDEKKPYLLSHLLSFFRGDEYFIYSLSSYTFGQLAEIFLVYESKLPFEAVTMADTQLIKGLAYFSSEQLKTILSELQDKDTDAAAAKFIVLKLSQWMPNGSIWTPNSIPISPDKLKGLLTRLKVFYQISQNLAEEEQKSVRSIFGKLTFKKARHFLDLAIINPKKPYLLSHLLKFFEGNYYSGKSADQINLLAGIFLCYESKLPFEAVTTVDTQLIKALACFSSEQLKTILSELQDKNTDAAAAEFIVLSLLEWARDPAAIKFIPTQPDRLQKILTKLKIFYQMSKNLDEEEQKSVRFNFEKLKFNTAHLFLELATRNPGKPYLLFHLLKFFEDSYRSRNTLLRLKQLAETFLLYESKLPAKVVTDEEINLVKSLEDFNAGQLKTIFNELNQKNINAEAMEFVLSGLRRLTSDKSNIEVGGLESENIKSYTQKLLLCFSDLNELDRDKKNQACEKLKGVSGEKLCEFLDFIHEDESRFFFEKRYLPFIQYVISLFSNSGYNAEFCRCLSKLTQLALNCIPKILDETAQALYPLLEQTWTDTNRIKSLLALIEGGKEFALQLALDGFFDFDSSLNGSNKSNCLQAVREFYSLVQQDTQGNVFSNLNLFAKDRTQRIAWMELLLSGSLVSKENTPELFNPWTAAKNSALLAQFLQQYTNTAKNAGTLQDIPLGAQDARSERRTGGAGKRLVRSVGSTRRLQALVPVQQLRILKSEKYIQARLLALSGELNEAYRLVKGADDPIALVDVKEESLVEIDTDISEPKITSVSNIGTIIEHYANIGKSSERIQQLTAFQAKFNPLISQKPMNYPATLKAIADAKRVAIAADRDCWFKRNTKGESRYLTMLGLLEDEIAQKWASDPDQITSFYRYTEEFNKSLTLAVGALNASLPDTYTELRNVIENVTIASPRSYTEALAKLNYYLSSESFPGYLKALALPLANKIHICVDQHDLVRMNTNEINCTALFTQLYRELDTYTAVGGKSSDRITNFNTLKGQLNSAIQQDDYYSALRAAISAARGSAMQVNTSFFKPHYYGDSRYLNLLGRLSDLVLGNNPNQDWLNQEYQAAKTQFSQQLQTFYDEKQLSFFGKQAEPNEFSQLLPKLKQENSDPPVIIEDIKSIQPHLPGYLQVLANEVIKMGEKMEKQKPGANKQPGPVDH